LTAESGYFSSNPYFEGFSAIISVLLMQVKLTLGTENEALENVYETSNLGIGEPNTEYFRAI
jgi:hypothetical protein